MLLSCPEAYQLPNQTLQLAFLLGLRQSSDHAVLRALLTEQAVNCGDYDAAYQQCMQLVESQTLSDASQQHGMVSAWELCFKLGINDAFPDLSARQQLLSLALMKCPSAGDMEAILPALKVVEEQHRKRSIPNNKT